jgi:alpha-galactosidase/6-phospho-beta-glucosidase family protein
MPKITFVGAGSTVFAKNLLGDILAYPELGHSTIALHDIDSERLNTTQIVAQRLAKGRGAHPRIETHLDRCAALEGADYVISMFQIGGFRPSTVIDFDVPKKYGLRQTIGDTLGIGGIMRGLRTIPVFLDLAADMERVCPDAWLLNYVNPMAINTWAIQKATKSQERRPLPQRSGDRRAPIRGHRGSDGRDQLRVRGHQPHGLLPQLLAPYPRRQGGRPVPGAAPGDCRRPGAGT